MDSTVEEPTQQPVAGIALPSAPATAPVHRTSPARRVWSPLRRSLAPVLAILAVLVALAAQFGITQGSPLPHPAYGFVLAVLLFAAAAFVFAHPGARPLPVPMAAAERAPFAISLRWELILLAGVIGLAIFFRFFRFTQFPPGLWSDEGFNGTDAIAIMHKHHLTVWSTALLGRSTVYLYLLGLSFNVFGYTLFAMRIVPALAGVLAVIAFYFLARWLLGAVPALVATALLAVSRYAVTFSRISWEASLQPLFEIIAVYFLVRALDTRRRLYFVLAGAALAGGLYTYLGFRIVPVIAAFILVYAAITERRLILRNISGLALYAAAFAIVVIPLGQYTVLHQDAVLARTRDVNVFKEIDRDHSYEPLRHNIRVSLEMMNVHGDSNGRHNLPGAPTLDEISGALLVLGLAVCAWSVRNWRKASMAGWLVLALIPGALTISVENPSGIRAVGAIPPLFLIAGIAVAFLYRVLTPTRAGAALFAVGAVALVGSSAALNYHQLFDDQAHSQAVYDAFIPVFTDVARLAASHAPHDDVFTTTEYYTHPSYTVLTHGKTTQVLIPSAQIILPRSSRDAFLIMDERDFGVIPTLQRLYPHLQRHDNVDPFGRTAFTSITIPQTDIAALHALPFSLYAGTDTSSTPVSTSNEPPGRAWTPGDLGSAGSVTGVWEGHLWVPSYPGNTTITLSSPGPVGIEIDGATVAIGTGSVTSPPRTLTFGEHTVRLIAGATTPGPMRAEISVDGVAKDAADVLYGASTGAGGFQALFRTADDFSTAPVQIAHVPFAVGALPPGVRSGEYRGIYDAPSAGVYGFAVDAGSSAQLFVDDALVVDNGGSHAPRRVEGTVQLTAGSHVISLQYNGASPAPWALYLRAPGGDWKRSDGSEFTAPTTFVQPALVTLALDPAWPVGGRQLQGLDSPDGVAVLPDGTVVSGARDTVVLVAADGAQRSFKTPATDIADVDTTTDGRIVLLDGGSKSLFVVSPTGDVLQRFNGAFASASGVGVFGDVAYVTSPSGGVVYKVPLAGGAIETLPISTAAPEVKAVQPSDIAVAADGTLYMNDFEKRQLVISPDGVTSHKTPGASGTGAQVPHVAIYGKLVLITDPLNQRILVDDLQGKQRGAFQFPTGPTSAHATGIAVGPHGEVYVVDPVSARLYRLTINIPAAATDLAQ